MNRPVWIETLLLTGAIFLFAAVVVGLSLGLILLFERVFL